MVSEYKTKNSPSKFIHRKKRYLWNFWGVPNLILYIIGNPSCFETHRKFTHCHLKIFQRRLNWRYTQTIINEIRVLICKFILLFLLLFTTTPTLCWLRKYITTCHLTMLVKPFGKLSEIISIHLRMENNLVRRTVHIWVFFTYVYKCFSVMFLQVSSKRVSSGFEICWVYRSSSYLYIYKDISVLPYNILLFYGWWWYRLYVSQVR